VSEVTKISLYLKPRSKLSESYRTHASISSAFRNCQRTILLTGAHLGAAVVLPLPLGLFEGGDLVIILKTYKEGQRGGEMQSETMRGSERERQVRMVRVCNLRVRAH
jgi:hypothetical protein